VDDLDNQRTIGVGKLGKISIEGGGNVNRKVLEKA